MTVSTPLSLRVGAKTHVGNVRTENQDCMSRFTSPLGEVFVVADGMGGHQGGRTAVLMTVDGFDGHLRNVPPDSRVSEALQSAAQSTNAKVYELANSDDPTIARMGSTVVLAVIAGDRMWIGHAGDSRAYLYRSGKLTRLTKDHSMVQKMIDHDMLTEEQARNHPDASVIERAFGQQPYLELEVSDPMELLPGDGILLCTDGLSGFVSDNEIAAVLERYRDAQDATAALIDLALTAGGEDNVTVQYLLFRPTDEQVQGAIETNSLQRSVTLKNEGISLGNLPWPILIAALAGGVLLGVLIGLSLLIGVPRIVSQIRQTVSSPTPAPVTQPSPVAQPSQVTPSPSPETPKQTEEQGTPSVAAPSSEPGAASTDEKKRPENESKDTATPSPSTPKP